MNWTTLASKMAAPPAVVLPEPGSCPHPSQLSHRNVHADAQIHTQCTGAETDNSIWRTGKTHDPDSKIKYDSVVIRWHDAEVYVKG